MASSITSAIQFISRPLEKVESQFTLDTLVFQTLSIIKRNADKGQKYTTIKDIDDFFRNSFYFSCGFKVDVRSYLKQLLNMDMISICGGPKQPSNDASNMPIGKGLDALREEPYNKNYNGKADIQSGAAFCITSLGYETIRFYLNPRTGFLIRNMLLASESYFSKTKFDSPGFFLRVGVPRKITDLSLIHTLMHAREFQNLWKTTKRKEDEMEFARDHIDEIMVNSAMYLQQKLTEDERKCLCTSMAFYDKLNMDDIEYRANFESLYPRFGRGDFAALQENMDWLVGATLRIAKVILTPNSASSVEITHILLTLSKRIDAGMVKDDLLELCRIREIGRIRSLALANAGIKSIKQLINPNNKRTVSHALESEQLAERVIDNAKRNQGKA
jgi:replicative superfamily II helicase